MGSMDIIIGLSGYDLCLHFNLHLSIIRAHYNEPSNYSRSYIVIIIRGCL